MGRGSVGEWGGGFGVYEEDDGVESLREIYIRSLLEGVDGWAFGVVVGCLWIREPLPIQLAILLYREKEIRIFDIEHYSKNHELILLILQTSLVNYIS